MSKEATSGTSDATYKLTEAYSINKHFCLQPSAKDQGITCVVVVLVLLHLVHFLIKRNLREKSRDSNLGPPDLH